MNILRAGLAEDGPALAGDGRLEPSTAVVAEASVITVGPAPNAVSPVGAVTLSLGLDPGAPVLTINSVDRPSAVKAAGLMVGASPVDGSGAVEVEAIGPVGAACEATGRLYFRSYSSNSRRWSSRNVLDFLPLL